MNQLQIVAVNDYIEAENLSTICRGSFGKYYPGFENWYRSRILPGIGFSRWLLKATINGKLVGISILKDDGVEKKICSLRVDINHRGQGIGSTLIKTSIDLLGENRPLITVPQEVVPVMSPILEKFRFEAMGCYPDFYRNGSSEFFYNGVPSHYDTTARAHSNNCGLITVPTESIRSYCHFL